MEANKEPLEPLPQNDSSREPSERSLVEKILKDADLLLKETRNYNSHINVYKRLLNLKDRNHYELFKLPKSISEDSAVEIDNEVNVAIESQLEIVTQTLRQLKEEVEASQILGLCLAFNLQCLRKRVTGFPIDVNSTEELVSNLQKKHEMSKTREAILKYEFQEKRKLLRKLRRQLEETREEWRNFPLKEPEKESEEEKLMWSQLMRKQFGRKTKEESEDSGFCDLGATGGSEVDSGDSAVQSESDDNCDSLAEAIINRKNKLDHLEIECYNLLSKMARRRDPIDESPKTERANEEYQPQLIIEINDELVELQDEELSFIDEEYDELPINNNLVLQIVDDNIVAISTVDDVEAIESSEDEATSMSELQNSETTTREEAENVEEETQATVEDEDDDELINDDVESFAETGEPRFLCRLRRKAVEILISRLRDEKLLHESREFELKEQLSKVSTANEELQQQLTRLRRFIYAALLVGGLFSSIIGAVIGKNNL